MATNEENDLIGYDPLAWMDGDTDKNEDHLITDDLAENADEIAVSNITDESVLIEEMADDFMSAGGLVTEEPVTDDYMDAGGTTPRMEEVESRPEQRLRPTQESVAEDSLSEETGGSLIDLDATLSIQHVVTLHEKLKHSLAIHDEIEINASDVSSIDTATLQLLVSLKKEAVKLQKKVTIIYPSPRFVESVRLLGLLDVLGVQDV